MTMTNSAGDFAPEDGERPCETCGTWMRHGDQANPMEESEAYCDSCWDGIPHDFDAVPESVDDEKTTEAAPVPLERWVDLVRAGGAR